MGGDHHRSSCVKWKGRAVTTEWRMFIVVNSHIHTEQTNKMPKRRTYKFKMKLTSKNVTWTWTNSFRHSSSVALYRCLFQITLCIVICIFIDELDGILSIKLSHKQRRRGRYKIYKQQNIHTHHTNIWIIIKYNCQFNRSHLRRRDCDNEKKIKSAPKLTHTETHKLIRKIQDNNNSNNYGGTE